MQTFAAGTLRHQVDVYRPSSAVDSRGQRTGSPTRLLRCVPCSIETLSGLELIRARKLLGDATHRVRFYADPDTPLNVRDYLVFGTRNLYIGHINDADQLGTIYELLCTEDV